MSAVRRISSKRAGYFAPWSRVRYVWVACASVRSVARLRAAWLAQAAVGCAVVPRVRTRRVACSMTARMY